MKLPNIDYDTIEKAKEIWTKVDEFDKAYLSTKAVFRGMHRVGILDDEMHEHVVQEYDKFMMPVNEVIGRAESFATEQATRFLWNLGLNKLNSKKDKKDADRKSS